MDDEDVLGNLVVDARQAAPLSTGPQDAPGMFPRRGRKHQDMLAPIEAETDLPGRAKRLHAILMHATDPRDERATPHATLRSNALDFAAAFDEGAGEEACEALFDA